METEIDDNIHDTDDVDLRLCGCHTCKRVLVNRDDIKKAEKLDLSIRMKLGIPEIVPVHDRYKGSPYCRECWKLL